LLLALSASLLVSAGCKCLAAVPPAEVAAQPSTAAPLSSLSLEDLMNVQVMNVGVSSVSRQESTLGESPAAVTVITSDMIRRSGATSIAETLRMVPGMHVARVDANKWAISARGFNSTIAGKMLVQVDGRAVYTPIFSGVYWDTVDYVLEDIERIEVIRGPGGTVWGANAVNGIVNIITKSAKDTQGLLFSGIGGNEDKGIGSFRFGGQIGDNVRYRVYGKVFERDAEYRQFDDNHDNWRGGRAGMRLDWTPGTDDTITLQGDWFHSAAGRTTSAYNALNEPPFVARDIKDEVTNGGNVLARWTHVIDPDSNIRVQAYWDRFDRQLGQNTAFLTDNYDFDFQHQFAWGSWQKLIYGLGYRYTDYTLDSTPDSSPDTRPPGTPKPPEVHFPINNTPDRRTAHLFSAFLQDQIEIVPKRFSFIIGTKLEHNDFTGWEVQPSGRLLWTPTQRQTAWLAVSRAVRTPGFVEDEIQAALPPAQLAPGVTGFPEIVGNTKLRSERVVAYELGYRAQATEKVSFDLALFYNVYDDLTAFITRPIVIQPDGKLLTPFGPANRLEGETYGAEIAATWQATDWWQIYAAYSYIKLNLHRKDADLLPADQAFLAMQELGLEQGSARNQAYVRSSMNFPGHIEFDVIGRYVDIIKSTSPNTDSYVTMDARLAWKPNEHLELAVVGQNLLDDHHPEAHPTGAAAIPVEIARAVYGQVTIRW
jgi:iron complex outermembrane receptor protein